MQQNSVQQKEHFEHFSSLIHQEPVGMVGTDFTDPIGFNVFQGAFRQNNHHRRRSRQGRFQSQDIVAVQYNAGQANTKLRIGHTREQFGRNT